MASGYRPGPFGIILMLWGVLVLAAECGKCTPARRRARVAAPTPDAQQHRDPGVPRRERPKREVPGEVQL
ncbi:hypothetical protein [Anaeromyxobacter sp. SG66]|uniref:hypothetical protein n=1 Tax=Anaeromyxobacter sp. SG66 TaxID=2925410 RepID=UPI001F5782C4|nr:hypothetical protein [Anaeromyxobacter sp. SG66]